MIYSNQVVAGTALSPGTAKQVDDVYGYFKYSISAGLDNSGRVRIGSRTIQANELDSGDSIVLESDNIQHCYWYSSDADDVLNIIGFDNHGNS